MDFTAQAVAEAAKHKDDDDNAAVWSYENHSADCLRVENRFDFLDLSDAGLLVVLEVRAIWTGAPSLRCLSKRPSGTFRLDRAPHNSGAPL